MKRYRSPEMVWYSRNEYGDISGTFSNEQDFTEGQKPDNDPEIIAFNKTGGDYDGAIKRECGVLIRAVADNDAQRNMADTAASGEMVSEDLPDYVSYVRWKASMVAESRALVSANESGSPRPANWPVAPANVIALAEKF